MSSTDSAADDHAYFQAIESSFIRLRGAPLLLSPADWQLAREWHRQAIPLQLVLETLEEVFASRQARGAKGKVQGLRYCAPAVEKAWLERAELGATGERHVPSPIDVPARLRRLSEILIDSGSAANELAERVINLEGTPEVVEAALAQLDREMIETAANELGESSLAEIERSIEESMNDLRSRLEQSEASRMSRRLLREGIRRRLDLPVLSLFAAQLAQE